MMRQILKTNLTSILMLALLIGSFSILNSSGAIAQTDTCTVKASTAVPDAQFDDEFTENGAGQPTPAGKVLEGPRSPGWTGGDSTYSIRLPNGDSAFFFSDSYIGQAPPVTGDGTATTNANGLRTRAINCDTSFGCYPPTNLYRAHNSIVVRSADGRRVRTIAGPVANGYSTSYFVPAAANHFYWVGDSVLVHRHGIPKVLTILMEWDGSLKFYGTAIAQLSVPDLKIEAIQPLTNDPAGDPVHWGVSIMIQRGQDDSTHGENADDNPTLYIYGIQDYLPFPAFGFFIDRLPHVARVHLSRDLSGIADTNNWEVYDSTSGWVSGNLLASSPIIGAVSDPNNANDSIGEQFTVKKIHSSVGTSYLMVTQDTNPNTTVGVDNLPVPPNGPGAVFVSTAKEIVLYSACSPEGPWSAKQGVYVTPETQATTVPGMVAGQALFGHLWTYNPSAHPQFDRDGELLVSYSVNSDDSGDLVYADAYRPRFIRIPIDGLHLNFRMNSDGTRDNGNEQDNRDFDR